MKKLLVANRSEIACRVLQAARELGLKAVGIYVAADEDARHVTQADEVYEVPGYLDGAAIVEVAKKSGVSLIHPGYGFLSERAEFAELVEAAGIGFLGPRAETIRALGDKISSKRLCDKVGVPTSPWATVTEPGELEAFCKKHGYPVLLKASAGGGGKGMRVIQGAGDIAVAFESAAREAQAAFGDGSLFVERLIEGARHIEVQFFGDGRGLAEHFFERECSLQRRHQKIWEESPAVHLPEALRDKMTAAACELAKSVKYRSAGTAEYLVRDNDCYFLEVNSRLQVEHPVTELVTGSDLVALQIELGLSPDKFQLPATIGPQRGHSIEVRICAEDPAKGFMPGPGRIELLRWPTGTGIRVESGIEEGQEIKGLFDSMLAKLIVWAPTREKAIARMRAALRETVVLGLATNIDYLSWLCDRPEVQRGHVTTKTLDNIQFTPAPTAKQPYTAVTSAGGPWFEVGL